MAESKGQGKGRRRAKAPGRAKSTGKKKSTGRPKSGEAYSEADVISALDHVRRRQILRLLHELDGPRSPVRTAERLEEPLSAVAYHFRVLLRRKIISSTKTVPVRGAAEHLYSSQVEDDPLVVEMLERTREADERRKRGC